MLQGKVRVREDQVQVSCDSARFYEPPAEGEESAPAPRPEVAEAPVEKPAPEERHRLIINIRQTDDKDADISLLNEIVAALRGSPGRDEVHLNILNGGEAIPLKLPNLQTSFDTHLSRRLTDLVGEDGFTVETIG